MKPKVDLYLILGVDRKAAPDDLKRAYKQLALKHHPDKNTDDPNAVHEFQQIGLAYRVLSDPEKRKHYDMCGSTEEADEDVSPDDFMAMFHEVLMDMLGGVSFKEMFTGMSPRELREMPPFPFPKELFPQGTFPPGMRFAKSGIHGMPPSLIDMLTGGQASDMAGLFFGSSGSLAGSSRSQDQRFHRGPDGRFPSRGDRSDSSDSDSSGGWETASDDEEEEEEDGEGGEDGDEEAEGVASDTASEAASEQRSGAICPPGTATEGPPQHHSSELLRQPEAAAEAAAAEAAAPAVPQSAQRDWFAAAKLCSVPQMASLLQRHPALLLARGAGLGHSALHWCAARGDEPAVSWLLGQCRSLAPSSSGGGGTEGQGTAVTVGVNLRNEVGSTPLHAAASNGCALVVSLLLREPGINGTLLDDDGRTAEQAALDRGHAAVSVAIREHLKQASGPPSSQQQQQEGCTSVVGQATSGSGGVDTVKCGRAIPGSMEESVAVLPEELAKATSCSEVQTPHVAEGAHSNASTRMTPEQHEARGCFRSPQAAAAAPAASMVDPQPVTPSARAAPICSLIDSPEPPSSSEAAGSGGSGPAGAAERARRRAALLAESAAADALEERRDAQRQRAAAAASVACGVPPERGRAWLDAAKGGHLGTLASMLSAAPTLLHYQGEGTNYSFTAHTALHWTAAKGHAASVRWLLAAGASAAVLNASGATPLHAAADNQQLGCVEMLLLLGGADAQLSDELGSSPRDMLLARGGPVQRLDLMARAAALLRPTQEAAGGGGGDGPVASPEARLAEAVMVSKHWPLRDMRLLLAAGGVNSAGMVERGELQVACQQLIKGLIAGLTPLPPSIPLPRCAGAPHTTANSGGTASGYTRPAPTPVGPVGSGRGSSSPSCSASDDDDDGLGEAAAAPVAGCAADGAVDSAKLKGNAAFSSGDFKKAVSHYTMALRLSGCGPLPASAAVLFSNRSAAYSSIGYYGRALEDAEEALKLDPGSAKYHVRKAASLLGMRQRVEATQAYREALRVCPGYQAAEQGLKEATAGDE